MRLAIFWSEILHYHSACIRELSLLAEARGHTVQAFALRSADPALPLAGYHGLLGGKIEVLSDDFGAAGADSRISQRQVVAYLDRHAPDAVAIPGYSNRATFAALRWCRRHRRGAVLMTESQAGDYARSPITEWVKRGLVACFDSTLVGGTPHVAYAQALGMPPERIFVGYDAVDNDFWAGRARQVRADAAQWRAQLGLPEHFFLTASRLVPKKNVAGLLRAYARYAAQAQAPLWPLLIVGDGPLKPELEQLSGELGLTGRVHFRGYLSANEMAPFYALASAFILASSYSEQWGLVVNEAMSAGTPVLVSRVCGSAADLVVDGETGFQVRSRGRRRAGASAPGLRPGPV